MIFYQLVCCGLLVQLAAALPINGFTQPPPAARCQQLAPVTRPKGEAVLVCDVSGIRRDDVMFYWWFNKKPDNTRMPVYIYSNISDVDAISPADRDMIIDETHIISDDHVQSQIKLRINPSSNYVILFELTAKGHASIADQVNINFEDPHITIDVETISTTFAEGSKPAIYRLATCYVDVCFGKPIMSIICKNIEDEDVTVIHEESLLDPQMTYFSGRHRIVMLHRNCLQVTCSVFDERGTYHATRNITHHDQYKLMLDNLSAKMSAKANAVFAQRRKLEKMYYIYFVVFGILWVFWLIDIVLITKRRHECCTNPTRIRCCKPDGPQL